MPNASLFVGTGLDKIKLAGNISCKIEMDMETETKSPESPKSLVNPIQRWRHHLAHEWTMDECDKISRIDYALYAAAYFNDYL